MTTFQSCACPSRCTEGGKATVRQDQRQNCSLRRRSIQSLARQRSTIHRITTHSPSPTSHSPLPQPWPTTRLDAKPLDFGASGRPPSSCATTESDFPQPTCHCCITKTDAHIAGLRTRRRRTRCLSRPVPRSMRRRQRRSQVRLSFHQTCATSSHTTHASNTLCAHTANQR